MTSKARHQEYMKHHPEFADLSISKEGKPDYSKNLNYFAFGALPLKQTVSINKVCGNESFRQAYVSHHFWQSLVSIVTIGIYTPRTIEVWCGPIRS